MYTIVYPRVHSLPLSILSVGLSSVLVSRCTPLRHPIDRRGIGRATRGYERISQGERGLGAQGGGRMKVLQHEGLLHLEKNRINNMIVIKSGR